MIFKRFHRTARTEPGHSPPWALGLLLGVAACSLGGLVQNPPPVDLRDEVLTIGFDPREHRLTWNLRGDEGETRALSVTGVTLILDDAGAPRRTLVPFAGVQVLGSRLLLRCEPIPDHEIQVQVSLLDRGRSEVVVSDRIAARALVRELKLDYEVGLAPLDESFAPSLQPDAASVLGDDAFHVPLVFLRAGRAALGLTPDLRLLQRERPLPQALELDVRRPPTLLAHGFVAAVAGAEGFTREGAAPALARGETLVFAHELTFTNTAQPQTTLAAAVDRLWAPRQPERDSPTLTQASERAEAALFERFSGAARGEAFDPELALRALLTTPATLEPLEGLGLAARALAERHAREPVPRRARLATALCGIALAAPRRAGLFPTACSLLPGTTTTRWHFPTGSGERYDASAIALAYRQFARAADALADHPGAREVREQLDRNLGEVTRFFTSNQLLSGAIPVWYESQYLVPSKVDAGSGAQSAVVALLLAEHGARTRDPALLGAARRALGFVRESTRSGHAWPGASTVGRSPDARGDQPFREALPIACAALAAVALHGSTQEPGLVPLCEELLHELALLQAHWSPVWQRLPAHGKVLVGNDGTHGAAAVQALATEAFFAGWKLGGERRTLQRGVAALRWLVADSGPARPGSSLAGEGATMTLAAQVLREHGQVAVDLGRGWAEALDALAVDEFANDGQNLTLRFSTASPYLPRARVTFVAARDLTLPRTVVGDFTPELTTSEEGIARGLELPVAEAPGLRFLPPTELAQDRPWYPRAVVTRPLPAGCVVAVEIRAPGQPMTVLELFPVPGEPWLAARDGFDPRGLETGARLEVRLVAETPKRVFAEPRIGMRTIVLGERVCIDPGDDDEHTLQGGGASEVVRADDGRENARRVQGTGSFTYRIEVPREATQLILDLRISGLAAISSGTVEVHRDTLDGERTLRDEQLVLGDRRLWSRGSLALTFRSSDPKDLRGLALAKLRYRTEGTAIATPVAEAIGASFRSGGVEPRLSLVVVPVALADRPLRTDAEQVRQAFFGGPEYRMTPAPEPRRTAGSVAELVTAMSGTRTLIEGSVLPERTTSLVTSDLLDANACQRTLLDALGELVGGATSQADAIVLLIAGPAIRPELDGKHLRLGRTPVVFLPERSEDGAFSGSGRALAALLAATHGLADLARPELGNFGDLSLSSSRSTHLPSGISGVNLVRLGWCDQLTLPFASRDKLLLAPLHEGRTLYELPMPVPARGSVLVESRAGSRAEPGLTSTGLLTYWTLPPGLLEVQPTNAERTCPSLLRLSPSLPRFATPFTEGSARSDLFRADCDLDHLASPSLATLAGEGFWRLHRRKVPTGDQLAVEFLAVDLLESAELGFVRGESTPVGEDPLGAPASATRQNGKLVLTSATGSGPSISALFAPRDVRFGPCRVLVECKVIAPSARARLVLSTGKQSVACEVGTGEPSSFWIELDAEGFRDGDRVRLQLDAAPDATTRVRVEAAWLVPREPVLSTVAPDVAHLHGVRLHDGAVHGTAFTVREQAPNQPRLRIPTLWPRGTSWLRVRLGSAWSSAPAVESRLTVAIHARDGSRHETLADAVPWRSERGVTPGRILVLEIPPGIEERVAWIEFAVRGAPLEIVACEILRE